MTLGVKIELNKRSQELFAEYLILCHSKCFDISNFQSSVTHEQLIAWLCDEIIMPMDTTLKSRQDIEFIKASLHAELLRDLLTSMGGNNINDDIEESSPAYAKLKVILLALAGTLLAGCEGFDSITTMLSILSLPSLIILIAGLCFSILSIIVFYSYDLVQVSKTFGVSIIDAPKLLDIYLLQLDEIKSIRKIINTYKLADLSTEELIQIEYTLTMLQIRFKALSDACSQFENSINSLQIQITKIIVSSLAGLLFFGSGFFAGQSVAMFIAALYFPAVLPTFLPVLFFSAVVGVAALSLYWYTEMGALKQVVSGWFGLDEEKIAKLCNKYSLAKEEKKLMNLKEKVISTAKLTSHLTELERELTPGKTSVLKNIDAIFKTSNNVYSFYAPVQPQTNPESQCSLICTL